MPVHEKDGSWWWGGKGPFPSKAKAEEVERAAYANGYRGDSYDFSESTRSYDDYGRMDISICRISKECVSPYLGRSLPNWQALGLAPDRTYYIYRPAEELIRAAESFNSVPVTIEHPGQLDTPDTPQDRVGTTGTDTRFEAPYLITSLKLWDKDAIKGVEDRTRRELSIFPSCFEVDMTPGEFMGQAYHGIARNISGNSVALTYRGRIGAECAVGDSQDQKVTLMEGLKELIKEKFATASDSEVDEMAAGVLELLKKHEESEIKKDKTGDNDDPDKKKKDQPGDDDDQEDKDKKPMGDSAIRDLVDKAKADAVAEVTAKFNAAREAQRIVEPVFGHVSGDSADEIYKAALAQVGVDVAGLPSAALKPMTELAIKNKTAAAITTGDSADRGNPNDFRDFF
ncbi:DUF2213 domain-containing protein [Aeromonas hydrophila]|uniref:DUF2213 domain-containing protein n=1 Tax=Aeromonas hydrophila TaxID=644 RepID=UPI00236227FA|nr:DUF2213 domain-containing protein [Aeromonas hydrophila]